MTAGERVRLRFLFSALGCVPVFLAGWLGWLQVLQAGELQPGSGRPLRLVPRSADLQRDRLQLRPAPRGTVTDRNGTVLAVDCESYEIRALVTPPRALRSDEAGFRAFCRQLAERLADALVQDPGLADRAVTRAAQVERLARRLHRAFRLDLPWPRDDQAPRGRAPDPVPGSADILIDTEVRVLSVIEALRALDEERDSLLLDLQLRWVREQPESEITAGLLGRLQDRAVVDERGRVLHYEAAATSGLEALDLLRAGAPGGRRFHVDALARRFYAGSGEAAAPATTVVTTLDLELQKVAVRELEAQAAVAGGQGKPPLWGALVLVEIDSGDVLAAASWQRDTARGGGSLTPYQSAFEPGSIVKPLVFAYALQHAGLDWERAVDCSSAGHDHRRVVEETGRLVRDDHACGRLLPHGILVNSSNIGAVKVGALLSREMWRHWLDVFGVGRSLGLPLPHERIGTENPKGWQLTGAQFRRWTASSYAFGYEFQLTALQAARAYLTLLSGRARELRLLREFEVDGVRQTVPVVRGEQVLFDPPVIAAVTAAMVDVVSDEPGATGRHLVADFRRQDIELHGLLAGKTGTAVSTGQVAGRKVEVRNASFVGFVPAWAPRYLAVCILQRDDGARFYGGSYAAPAAARLLLEALRLEERRRLHLELQVSASPGQTGRGRSAPEQRQVGR